MSKDAHATPSDCVSPYFGRRHNDKLLRGELLSPSYGSKSPKQKLGIHQACQGNRT